MPGAYHGRVKKNNKFMITTNPSFVMLYYTYAGDKVLNVVQFKLVFVIEN